MRRLLLPIFLFTAAAFAQDAQQPAKKKKVIRLDAITVEGRIQKPQAFYILQRSSLNFDELNRAESFVPKVEKSVEKDAFWRSGAVCCTGVTAVNLEYHRVEG